jgi:iron complex outermembrane receptor protein
VAGAAPVTEDGYKELDASIGYDFTDYLGLTFNAINLLNYTYGEHVQGNKTAITNEYKIGREYLLSLHFKFANL